MRNDNDVKNIIFIGQDYSPILDAVKKIAETEVCPSDENPKIYWWNVLRFFLEDVAPEGFVDDSFFVNRSIESSRRGDTGKKRLYDLNFGKDENIGYFCGVVGVIKKTIDYPIIYSDTEPPQYQRYSITLQIKSRMDVSDDQSLARPYFLTTMLLRNRIKLSDNMVWTKEEDEVFDYLLLFWFKEQLQRAYLKGYYKTYRRFENNNDRLRGTIDFNRHIRLNMGMDNGRVAYSYRENTINNYLNQLIVVAYYHLKRKYRTLVEENFDNNLELKRIIDFLSNEVGYTGNNEKSLINKNTRTVAHPYYTEYEQLRVTCIKILRDQGLSIFDGEQVNEASGILFYLPDLWELYLEEVIFDSNEKNQITVEPQSKIKNFGYLSGKDSGKYEFKQDTYPDYIISNEDKPFMILDAKFKPAWEGIFNRGSVSLVMEDYNKCIRDMVSVNSHATGVIFPTNIKEPSDNDGYYREEFTCHRISEYNAHDLFYTFPVFVPKVSDAESYMEWRKKFDSQIEIAKKYIWKTVETEKTYSEKWTDYPGR